jgi:aconitate hydratase
MVRAAFYSKSLRNLLWPESPVGQTLHVPSGTVAPIFDVAGRYRDEGAAVVLLAGERYGTGSSRDWVAKGQRLLGIRAVLAQSFERIHRSNLIGMGILPLRVPPECAPDRLRIVPGDRIGIDAPADAIEPRATITVRVLRADGGVESYAATAAVETRLEVDLLRQGGVIPYILQKSIAGQRTS